MPLDNLIANFFKEEQIDDFLCEHCKKKSRIIKSQELFRFPEVLIVFIKRFVFYPKPKKLTNCVAIEDQYLDLSSYLYHDESSPKGKKFVQQEKKRGRYKLTGFIEHYGEINYGHYVSYCFNEEADKWILYNDNRVKVISDSKFIFDTGSNVYVMFYRRC